MRNFSRRLDTFATGMRRMLSLRSWVWGGHGKEDDVGSGEGKAGNMEVTQWIFLGAGRVMTEKYARICPNMFPLLSFVLTIPFLADSWLE